MMPRKYFFGAAVIIVFLLIAAKLWPEFFSHQAGGWFLPMHAVLECFGALIVISLSLYIFLHSELMGANRNLWLAGVLFTVGILDILHALSFAGMPQTVIFPSVSTSYYFWLAARLIIAGGLIIFAKWHPGTKNKYALPISVASGLLITSFVYSIIYSIGPEIPPLVNIMGSEAIKIYFEYLIIGLLLLGGLLNFKNLKRLGEAPFYCFLIFLMLAILSESYNIFSQNIFDLCSVFSHVFKDIAYIFLFISLFNGLKKEAALKEE